MTNVKYSALRIKNMASLSCDRSCGDSEQSHVSSKKLKIHFIYPDISTGVTHQLNLGLASISAVLKKNQHEVALTHLTKEPSKKDILKEISQKSPDFIGFSSTTNQFHYVELISKWIKEEFPKIPIVVGGVHATLAPDNVIQDKNIDFVCIGEGEYPLLELLEKGANNPEIQNIWSKGRKNPIRPLIDNLDSLPFPDYDLFDITSLLKEIDGELPLLAGRGCPYPCTYCSNHAIRKIYSGKGEYVRYKSVDYLLEEIEHYKSKYKFSKLAFCDDTFTLNRKWIKDFSQKYPARFSFPYNCNARVENVTPDLIKDLKSSGCEMMSFGIESGSEWLRKEILKKGTFSNQKIEEAFRLVNDSGIRTFSYNMIGLPFETPKMIQETIDLNKKIKPSYIVVFIYYPYPSTELYEICKENGWLTRDSTNSYLEAKSLLNMSTITHKQILQFYDKFNKVSMESYVRTDYPTLMPLFRGMCFLIGGTRTRKLLANLKYNNVIRPIYNSFLKRDPEQFGKEIQR